MASCSFQGVPVSLAQRPAACRAVSTPFVSRRCINWGDAASRRGPPRFRSASNPGPRCQAAGFSQQAASDEAARLPQSREDAVQQAAAAIAAQLEGAGGKGKGFAGATSCRKLAVDVPVVESGGAAMLQLATDILAALPKPLRQQFTIVACTEDGAAPTNGKVGGVTIVGLRQCLADEKDLDGCLLIAGPTKEQLEDVMRLLAYWRGPAAIALNADWSAEHAPVEQVAFVKSFEAVYCFLPLMVKVLFIGQEGAVFKWCTGGNPASAPWRIFGKEGSKLAPIGRMTTRPTNADLEACFYNAYAANNPLTKGLNFITGKGKQKGV